MSRAPKDGRVLSSGVVKAAEIATGLGLGGATPREGKVPDSPRQARLRAEGKDREADALASDDFEVTIVDAAEHYALWGSPELSAPAGSPDGTPVPLPPTAKPRPQKADWEKVDGGNTAAPSPTRAQTPNEAAEQLRADAQEHARRMAVRTRHVIVHGDAEAKRRAAKEAETSTALVRQILDKIGGSS